MTSLTMLNCRFKWKSLQTWYFIFISALGVTYEVKISSQLGIHVKTKTKQLFEMQCYQIYASCKGWSTIGFGEAIKTLPWAVASLYLVVNVALVMFKGKDILRQVNKVKKITYQFIYMLSKRITFQTNRPHSCGATNSVWTTVSISIG